MTIAVQISLAGIENNTNGNFNYQCFSLLAAEHPHDHFIFIFDSPYDPALIVHPNITPVLLGPQMKNSLLQHYWYNFKLPRVLNKYNAAIFISSGAVCSMRTNAEQFIHINETASVHKADQSRYLKKNLPQFIDKAATVIVPDIYLQHQVLQRYEKAGSKAIIISPGIEENIRPFTYEKKNAVIDKLVNGAEYFVYYDTGKGIEKTITVLKAFSLFKKWQLSAMNLVIIGSPAKEKKLNKSLSTYKFRQHVKLITDGDQLKEIFAAAYAAILLPGNEKFMYEIRILIKSGTPVILEEQEYLKSFFGNAALYTTVDEKAISDSMMLLYKDENRRNKYIAAGHALAGSLNWQHSAALLWQTITPVTEP